MTHLTSKTQINTSNNIHAIDSNSFVVSERKFLFQMGDQLDGIYRVNSGCVKLSRNTADGEKQIIGFYMAGDLIALDALADGFSHSTAVVLETANISLIPFATILNQDAKFDHHAFMHQLGVNYNNDNDHTMMLSQPAERRLAWFITKFSDGLAKRGMIANKFRMPMTGTDLASYLGMALETLSREIRGLCKQGLLNKSNRNIELLDMKYLIKIAAGGNADQESFANANAGWETSTNRTISY
ncbi:MAG: helix-turn-helix domain-containing protein [Cocleimonas sp.]